MSKALVLSCSRRKDTRRYPVPAINRYDGPLFRVLRRFLSARPTDPLSTWVVSAEFGLIAGGELVPCYDHAMTAERAQGLRESIAERFAREISASRPHQLFVSVGPSYEEALTDCWSTLDPAIAVRFATGGIGGRASQLHDWLHGEASRAVPMQRETTPKGVATLLGITIRLSVEEVLEVARTGLREKPLAAGRFQAWSVPVDGERVAPKWLVSELSGLPVGKFRTADALRVLSCLGVAATKNPL